MIRFTDDITTLELEELKSEYTRALLLIGLFSVILCIAILNYLFAERSLAEFYGGFYTFIKIIGFIVVFILYQLLNIRYLRKRMRPAQPPTLRYKIIQTIVEITIPSSIMMFIMGDLKMLSFIDTPVMLVYFL